MLTMPRRQFLIGSALPALVGAMKARAAEPVDIVVQDGAVQLRSDGLALSPADYARLLGRLADDPGIEADEYSRHGVVASLEARFAELLGKDMAVYLPTGTLANHLALRRLARDGRRVLVQQESHVYNDEGDCAQQLSGLTLVPLAPGRATFTLADVEAELRSVETGRVHAAVGAISIESPVRRVMGEVFDFAEMQKIAAFARERRIGLHLDGARLFLASAYTGISPATCAALFDTVYVSLYKYFNAASGAILAGPRHLLENLYHERRMFGGGLQQVWPDAAVALHYLDGFPDRYARAVAAAFRRVRRFCAADHREPAETSGDANHSRVYGSVRIVRNEVGSRTCPGWATKRSKRLGRRVKLAQAARYKRSARSRKKSFFHAW